MAEGWVRHDLGDRWEVASAGTYPASVVHPFAVRVMAEAGVDISARKPKHVNSLADERWDLVVTVCDSAREACPVFPAAAEQIHVGFPDPVAVPGTEEERLAAYRAVRDDIRAHLVPEIARRS
jgi:arsenate reductase